MRMAGSIGTFLAAICIACSSFAEAPISAQLLSLPQAEFNPPEPEQAPDPGPARLHVLVDAKGKSALRQMVRIADMFPGQSLDFQWSPDASNAAPTTPGENLAQGKGVLTWRISGLPTYDPRNIFARYEGALRDGYPEGKGKIRYRSGATYDGEWRAGRPHGVGRETNAEGEHYFGGFANGRREGPGRLVLSDRTTLDGTFRGGAAHGTFDVTLPGGTKYSSTWNHGTETGRDLETAYLDSTLAGLLRAQSGDAASRTALSVVLDAQATSRVETRYVAVPGNDRTLVYTEDADLVNAWNGTEPMQSGVDSWAIFDKPWDEIYAYLNAVLQTSDGTAVQLDRLWLEVASSTAYLKPMLQMSYFYGDVAGFNAEFTMVNRGWGAVESARFDFRITDPSGRSNGSQQFSVPVSPFDREGGFNVEPILAQQGVDVQQLRNARFPCPSRSVLNQCISQAASALKLGTLAPYLGSLDDFLVFVIDGSLTFSWKDAGGALQTASQPVQNYIHLAKMDFGDLAELGSGWSDVPAAPQHVDIVLPVGRNNYRIDLPFRANANVRQFVYPMKFRAEKASVHDFRIGAMFRDGSVRYSAPVTMFYFRPRD